MKPPRPIKKIYVTLLGDPSVGIQGQQLVIQPDGGDWIIDDDADPEWLNEVRSILERTFGELFDDRARVLFDFEVEALEAGGNVICST